MTAPAFPAAKPERGSVFEAIELALVNFDAQNQRLVEAAAVGEIAELAGSMAQNGQVQPVGVVRDGDRFLVWYGHRRVVAARSLGWEKIDAEIFHERPGPAEWAGVRAVENLHRLALNPIEEAVAVTQMLEAVQAGEPALDTAAAHARVAQRLGKSVTWVRDRTYLARLSGESRELVLAKRLPLAHAREIATLADPRLRDELAIDYAADPSLESAPRPIELLRQAVAQHLFSLKTVPWRLEVRVEGVNAPACTECPSNSANDPHLFEHRPPPTEGKLKGPDSPAEAESLRAGRCTNRSCFERKRAAAEKAIAKAKPGIVKRLETAAEKGEAIPTGARAIEAAGGGELADKGIDPKALASAVRKEVRAEEPAKKRGLTDEEKAELRARRDQEEAERKLQGARNAWRLDVERQLFKALAAVPGRRSMLGLLDNMELFLKAMPDNYRVGGSREGSCPPGLVSLIRRLKKPTIEDVGEFERRAGNGISVHRLLFGVHELTRVELFGALGIEASRAPILEDYLPASPEVEAAVKAADAVGGPRRAPAPKAKAKKKGKGKKKKRHA